MDLHDCGKFKLRRQRSAASSEGAENSRDYARPSSIKYPHSARPGQGIFVTVQPSEVGASRSEAGRGGWFGNNKLGILHFLVNMAFAQQLRPPTDPAGHFTWLKCYGFSAPLRLSSGGSLRIEARSRTACPGRRQSIVGPRHDRSPHGPISSKRASGRQAGRQFGQAVVLLHPPLL